MKQIIFSIIAIVTFSLCTNHLLAQTPSKTKVKALENYANLENYMQGFMTQVHSLTSKKAETCATVNHNKTAKTVTLSFNNGCTTPNGKSITGTLVIGYVSGQVNDVRSVIVTDLVIDGNFTLNGRWEMSKAEVNSADQIYCTATFTGTVTFVNTTSVLNYSSSHILTWIDGAAITSNTKIAVTGGGTLTNKGTATYVSLIDNNDPLIYDLACLESGTYTATSGTIAVDFGLTYTFDYGDGSCDNMATISYEFRNARGQVIEVEKEVDMTEFRKDFFN